MAREIIQTPNAPAAVGAYSQAVKVGPLVFVSGQVPIDIAGNRVQGGVAKETERCLENIKAVLEAAGARMEHITKTTVYLSDMGDFKFMNQVYERYFPANPPARTTVQVGKLPKEAKVEIDAIAVIG